MNSLANSYNPDRIFAELETAAEGRAEAEYTAHRLERLGEILLAELQVEAKQTGQPIGICKEIARADPKWRTHVEGESVAIRNRSRARGKYENLKILAEARRSQEASTRMLTGRSV
jgi:hypothetical protein